MTTTIEHVCNYCFAPLIPGYITEGGNWAPSRQRKRDYICGYCDIGHGTRGLSFDYTRSQVATPPAPRQVPSVRWTRPGGRRFRQSVIDRDGKCVVTGIPAATRIYSKGNQVSLVHAAHIKPFKLCQGAEYHDPDNGLALRADVHAAFDASLFTVSDDGKIIPSRWLHPKAFPWESLRSPLTDGQRHFLRGHREWCLNNWSRWAF